MITDTDWEICLLQECPPRWVEPLVDETGATGVLVAKTSRNWLGPVSGRLAAYRPDLLGSWEGGSNAILTRREAGRIVDREVHTLTRRPEKRTLGLALLGSGLVVGCLHLSTDRKRALDEAKRAIDISLAWAEERPLLIGGDWNLRPNRSLQRVVEEAGLTGLTPGGIDHLLVRGLRASAPRRWPEREREIQLQPDGLAVRLSDHAPVSREVRLD